MISIDKAELLELVFDHYGLRMPSGKGKILCPVHTEDRPSAVVDPTTGKWRCFACHQHGDGIDLISAREGVDFVRASSIAEGILNESGRDLRVGISGQSSDGVSRRSRDQRRRRKYVPSWLREA